MIGLPQHVQVSDPTRVGRRVDFPFTWLGSGRETLLCVGQGRRP